MAINPTPRITGSGSSFGYAPGQNPYYLELQRQRQLAAEEEQRRARQIEQMRAAKEAAERRKQYQFREQAEYDRYIRMLRMYMMSPAERQAHIQAQVDAANQRQMEREDRDWEIEQRNYIRRQRSSGISAASGGIDLQSLAARGFYQTPYAFQNA